MNWAIVTPSYKLDYDQCVLMCDSVDAFVQGDWHHYIIVNKVDRQMFAHLNGPRRTVLLNSEVLPSWLRYIGKLGKVRSGSMWFSWRTGIIFGWHLQQIVKLNMASFLNEEIMLLVDSDVFFVRPLLLDSLNGKSGITLCRTFPAEGTGDEILNAFNLQSQKTLGLPPSTKQANSAHPLVVWHRQTVLEMCDYIGKRHKKHWIAAIYGYRALSEGTLYGLYIDNIISDRNRFTMREISLVKGMRLTPPLSADELEDFFNIISPDEYALVVPSPIQFDVGTLRKHFQKISDRKSHQLAN